METVRIQNGQIERIETLIVDNSGEPVTGLSNVLLTIRRVSDDYWLDFNDNTFKASGWTTRQKVMAELDATNDAGVYYYDFDTSGFPDDTYQMRVECVSGDNVPQTGELKTGGYVDNISDIKRLLNNKLTIDEVSSKLQLWNDAGDTVLYEWPLTDKDGNAIVLQAGLPSNRGVPI
jgi:hypothetical protein